MQVDTRWFGTVDIDDNKIVTFDLGIIGFEDCKKFTLIYDVEREMKQLSCGFSRLMRQHWHFLS